MTTSINPHSSFAHPHTFTPVTPEIHKIICQLYEELDTHSIWQLTTNSIRLKNIGDRLRKEVHPFQMLIEIFTNAKTHRHFQSIFDKKTEIFTGRHQVWNSFVQGIGLNLESRIDEIEPYLDTFAKTMNTSPSLVRSHIKNKNYEGLLSLIIKNCPIKE